MPAVTVVGIGADGWAGLPARLRAVVEQAPMVLGGARHLAMLPAPSPTQRRMPWPSPLREGLPGLLAELDGTPVVALASGDPLVSGIGGTLVDLLGADRVAMHPAVSSVALACAELRWAAESCAVVSLVGRDPELVLRELAPGRRVLVLSSDEHTPGRVAGLLTSAGYGASTLHVLGDLGTETASRTDGTAVTWSATSPRLNVIGLELAGPLRAGWVAGLPDAAYEHDGQLTKRDLRASALARLLPAPGQLLWDVGAGAGSVGIEWMRSHPGCTAIAVEADAERAGRVSRNAGRLGVPGLVVVRGAAPGALAGLPRPDAVFVGGGASVPGVLDACLAALDDGGRLVIHAVTVETETVVAQAYREHGGELTRIAVETAAPVGAFTGWSPARTVTQWSWSAGPAR
ncbi:MAG: precorrin-6y C5,15-methyltransferase (decarboxylating) subunit CbiE [Dermatophilaceae bacterium]